MVRLIAEYPLFFTKTFIIFVFLKLVRQKLSPGALIFRWDGQYFKGDPSEERLVYALYFKGWHEFFTSAVINKYVKKGMTVLDVGAHIGWSSLFMAKRVGPKGKVIAFEPSKVYKKLLEDNISLNQYKNIEVFEKALTDKDEDQNIQKSKVMGSSEVSSVPCLTFDTFFQSMSPVKIGFVKIDIEGFEMDCLKGMSNFIQTEKPKITIEIHGSFLKEFGQSARNVIDFLEEHSYRIYFSTKITKQEMSSTNKHFHILAIPS